MSYTASVALLTGVSVVLVMVLAQFLYWLFNDDSIDLHDDEDGARR